MNILSIDFGGTRIRAAHFSQELALLHREETLSLVNQSAEQVIQRMSDLARQVMDGVQPTVIGLSAPGPLDADAGIIFHAKTLPGWENIPLPQILSRAFGDVPAFMHNDANLAALAETHQGAGRGKNPVIYLTLSTGIGGGAVINGELFTGWRGLAIEPGHVQILHPDGKVYRLEELASGTGIGNLARRRLAETDTPSCLRTMAVVDGKSVGEAAVKGDTLAMSIIHEAGYWLGIGLVNVLHLFNPEVIIVGGSVAQLGELIFAPARKIIQERILDSRFYTPDMIHPAQLGEDVCLVGAAWYARGKIE